MIDLGKGPPIVLIPGIQGRWEWMRPAVEAMAARARVLSYSLCGDRGSGCRLDAQRGFENYMAQLDSVLDQAGLRTAALCGVSYGGLIAVHYAARHPEKVSALVLASAPGPAWRPERRLMKYLRAPRLLVPLFVVRSLRVVAREVAAALPGRRERWAWRRRHYGYVLRAPASPVRMARRIRFALDVDFTKDCGSVRAPTLVITGEEGLDRIVGIDTTRDYLRRIPGAQHATFAATGHLGVVTQPGRFAEIVGDFVESSGQKVQNRAVRGDEAERGVGTPASEELGGVQGAPPFKQ